MAEVILDNKINIIITNNISVAYNLNPGLTRYL